ncbi:MAG: zinc/manganese transport system substrate-binding protein [Myxococcota bacterium]|jgi:zinc/manganese transport system substrate-binding protein
MQLNFNKKSRPERAVLSTVVLLIWIVLLPTAAQARVNVVTTIPSLAALATVVGGDDVVVQRLASPTADPHFVDGRPSFIVALNRADLLVHVGLDLEVGWLPPLLAQARNGAILSGRSGNLDASRVAGPLIGVGASTDRARGDVHAGGSPHFLLDPRMAVNVALAVALRLVELDPPNADRYRQRAAAFKREMAARIKGWERRLAPHTDKPIVSFHASTQYLARWLGLRNIGYIEALPGVAPNASHLAGLILSMRKNKVRVVLSEAWYDAETARVVAAKSGATLFRLPGDVGADGVPTYPALIELIVTGLENAL